MSTVASRLTQTGRLGGALALAGMVAFGATACEKVPLTAPIGTVLTLVAGTDILPINGITELTAVLIESDGDAGTPVHNGTVVTFTTSLGRIEPAEARTTNGRATVKLLADSRSGIATISAFSGSATQTIQVVVGAAAVVGVSVSASPSSLPPTGGVSTITARVEDPFGNPLTGVPVTFTTTGGSVSPKSALSNDSGIATTVLTTTVAAEVTASSGGVTGSANVSLRARSTVQLTMPTGTLVVGAPAVFTVTPGTVPLSDVTIDFGDGTSQSFGAISASTPAVHYYTDDGVFQISVRATDVNGGTAEAFGAVAVVPFTFSASASPTTAAVDTIILFSVDLPASVPIEKIVWNFGDGKVETTSSKTVSHGYQLAGLKTITVTVYPLYGDPRTNTFQVVITPMF